MTEHKSFLVYKSWKPLVAYLDDKSAGQLFKALFAFACDGECADFGETALSGIFQTMIMVIAADDEKYLRRCEVNSKNGRLGGRPTKETESFSEEPNESERFSEKPNVTQKKPIGQDMGMTGQDMEQEKNRQEKEVEEQQAALHAKLLEARERIEQNAQRA